MSSEEAHMTVKVPRDVCIEVRSPGGKLVEFPISLRNAPGALADVSKALADMGLNVLSGFLNACPEEATATWSCVADLKGLKLKPEDVLKQIKSLKCVVGASFMEAQFDGLIVDKMHFPLTIQDKRVILLTLETWGDMTKRLLDSFGSGAAVILYEMGFGTGENKAQNIVARYKVDGLKALKIILSERISVGWGIPEIVEFDEEKISAVILIKDLFECIPFAGRSQEAKSHFFRGYLAGIFKQLFNKKVTVEETKCVAKGDRNCLFKIV